MIRRTCLARLVLGIVVAAGLSPEPLRAAASSADPFGPLMPEPARVTLPAGFAAAVDLATSSQFVRVVADDIDRDGDIDVVASDGTLDLLVWENDGAGHFSRRRSSTHEELTAPPPAPMADGDGVPSNRWVQHEQRRALRPVTTAARVDEGRESPLTDTIRASAADRGSRLRPSRAPPAA
jgi:hypothetical protein